MTERRGKYGRLGLANGTNCAFYLAILSGYSSRRELPDLFGMQTSNVSKTKGLLKEQQFIIEKGSGKYKKYTINEDKLFSMVFERLRERLQAVREITPLMYLDDEPVNDVELKASEEVKSLFLHDLEGYLKRIFERLRNKHRFKKDFTLNESKPLYSSFNEAYEVEANMSTYLDGWINFFIQCDPDSELIKRPLSNNIKRWLNEFRSVCLYVAQSEITNENTINVQAHFQSTYPLKQKGVIKQKHK